MIPPGAVLRAELGPSADRRPVLVWDVSHLLPRHRSERYTLRPLEELRRIYVHHSGALRRGDPFSHLIGSARYAINRRGWPGWPYHFWVPHYETDGPAGARPIFMGNGFDVRTYHAGGHPNATGIAVCLQGNTTRHGLSPAQIQTLPILLRWIGAELAIDPTPLGHFQASTGHPKPTCPGAEAAAWILGWQAATT